MSLFFDKGIIMNKRIIHKWTETDPVTGKVTEGVAVIIPASFEDSGLTIEQIAAKDVPAGKPYKIVDVAEIPTDRNERDAWTVDESDLTDGVGADFGAGSVNAVLAWDENGKPVTEERYE
jgi:hypothetical protein